MPRMKDRIKNMAANAFVAIISTLLVLAAAEIATRIVMRGSMSNLRPLEPYFVSGSSYYVHTESDLLSLAGSPAYYGYTPELRSYIYSPEQPATVYDRSNFLFQHELSRYEPAQIDRITRHSPSAIRIFVIGASVAQGFGATGKEATWHAILETQLRKRFGVEDIYIFNGAIGAFISTQERVAYDLAIAPRNPDITILLDGFNDMFIPGIYGVRPGDPYQTGYRYRQIYDTTILSYLSKNSVLFYHSIGLLAYQRLEKNRENLYANRQASWSMGQGIVNVYTSNVDYLIRRGTDNSPLLVFFQPWRDVARNEAGLPPQSRNYWFYRGLTKAIRARFKDNPRFIDISSSMSDRKNVNCFIDLAHLNNPGQKILADAIYPYVEKEVERTMARRAANPPPRPQQREAKDEPAQVDKSSSKSAGAQ